MTEPAIEHITAREILDSRGDPTVEVTVEATGGIRGTAAVPAGASTGKHEAFELRDNDKARYGGKGMLKAIANVEGEIAKRLVGMIVMGQADIDRAMVELDGTGSKRNLGANAILGVSLAVARAAAAAAKQPLYRYLAITYDFPEPAKLPIPLMNIVNGGRHADNNLDVQEFMIAPKVLRSGSPDAAECIRIGAEVFHTLGDILRKHRLDTDVGNEGGYAPTLKSNEQVFELFAEAVTKAGYTPGKEVSYAVDVAASEFYRRGRYAFEGEERTAQQMVDTYCAWQKSYPLISIEDGLSEDDWQGWHLLTKTLGQKVLVVGDDLFVTQEERLRMGFELMAGNAIIIKPNQVGTLTETVATVRLAQEHGLTPIVSHRSGETTDTFIADLAVAVGAPYLKAGAPSRGERVAKYDRLMEIAHELKSA